MAIVINKNTAGTPLSTVGRTGTQGIKFIPAPRIYVKTADSITAAPVQNYFTKSAGVTPAGWTDLGIVRGVAKVAYTAKAKDISTGIDQVLRGQYLETRGCVIEFNLSQLDDVVLEQVSGVAASVVTAGSVVNYLFGSTDLNQMAMLIVYTNKLNGKEWQFYNPNAFINFTFDSQADAMELKCTAGLPFFTAAGASVETCLSTTVFA